MNSGWVNGGADVASGSRRSNAQGIMHSDRRCSSTLLFPPPTIFPLYYCCKCHSLVFVAPLLLNLFSLISRRDSVLEDGEEERNNSGFYDDTAREHKSPKRNIYESSSSE